MLGPLRIVYGIHLSLGSRGNDHIVVDIEMSGHLELDISLSIVLGSVNTPVRAEIAAVSGETR